MVPALDRWEHFSSQLLARALTRYFFRPTKSGGDIPYLLTLLLEHAVVVLGVLGDVLDHVPVLDDFAIVEPEEVGKGATRLARL